MYSWYDIGKNQIHRKVILSKTKKELEMFQTLVFRGLMVYRADVVSFNEMTECEFILEVN